MIAPLLATTACLAVGHALVLGLFWLLLRVPESNFFMLATSTLIVVAGIAFAGWVEGLGVATWTPGSRWRDSAIRSARALPGVPVAVLLFGLVFVLTRLAGATWDGRRGEIDAWLILHFGWARTAGLHKTVAWVLHVVRWVVGLSLALNVIGWAVVRGVRALGDAAWLAAAFSPRRLVLLGAILYGLIWLPWQAAYWRPGWLAPNWQEMVFVVAKLSLLYLVASCAWSGILKVVESGCRIRGGSVPAEQD